MPTARIRDIDIHFEERGSGDPLLYIGGTGGDLRASPNIFDSPLASRFRLLAFDQRGLGQSGKPPGPYTMADYADDAAGLMDHVGWDRAHVLGISFGGMVAQAFALRHGARGVHHVWCCTSAGGACGASYPLHELGGLSPRERAQRLVPIVDTRRDADWAAANPEAYQALVEQAAAPARNAGEADAARGAAGQLSARAAHDTCDRLGAVTLPVFLAGGRHDRLAPPARLEAIASRVPGAQLRFYEGGHLFFQQDPRAFADIGAFLETGQLPA